MTDDAVEREKRHWRELERERPAEIVVPTAGQESVWDYPRPPAVQQVGALLRVEFAGMVLAETSRGLRVLETSSPPVYYFPPADVRTGFLAPMHYTSLCAWKGVASYWTLSVRGRVAESAAWSYTAPDEPYGSLAGYFAFYAGRVDACYVGSERVVPQESDYYGGWVTSAMVGPFKGGPGTERW
jgi:uncharacterized protein (DUF427 family)